jgi:molybdopterin synthase catalytic subunit
MEVRVQEQALDPWRELAAGRQPLDGSFGGTAIFVGTMRDFNQGQGVERMTLEHYPGMTERYLREVCDEAAGRWELVDSLLVHRVGSVRPGDAIVLVAVWAVHRDAAFAACRFIIDELKSRAPFWKQEQTATGLRWVAPEGPIDSGTGR